MLLLFPFLLCCLLDRVAYSEASVTLTPPPNNASTSTRPTTLNAIWSEGPGLDWYTGAYPIGNGYLGETILGRPANDSHYINIASLWMGGPFRNSTYSGGNGPESAKPYYASALAAARAQIAANGTGSVDALMGNDNDPDYGSFSTAGLLTVISPSVDADITSYTRTLDFDQGLVNITWTEGGVAYNRVSFCSFPSAVCVTYTSANTTSINLAYSLSTPVTTVPNATCSDSTITQRGRLDDTTDGIAQPMLYEIQALVGASGGTTSCEPNGTVTVSGAEESWVIWSGETEFSLENCNRAANFSCKGADPHAAVTSNVARASSSSFASLLATHVKDYSALSSAFTLDIGQANSQADIELPTDQLVNNYNYDTGSPLLEYNVFSYGRHLLISSTRAGAGYVPPNLQGIWSQTPTAAWGSDFHSDINLEMMQWPGESTGIAEGIVNMGNWMLYAMADRGTDTATILYGAEGFVFHTQSNLFGYTGMQGYADGVYNPQWDDFTSLAAWDLTHLYDHYVYNPSDTSYLKNVTYPLMKRHAQFQMSFLVNDTYFNDGTLVISPCNSPEQTFVSLGCTCNQQQIFELLHNIRKLYSVAGDTDSAFLSQVDATLAKLYDGIRIGSWGQLQEWKIDHDSPTDLHRHLSHLLGVYPGWEISGYIGQSLGNQSVLNAAQVSLTARGNGTYDSNAGWEKIMRSVVASSLGNSSAAGFEYRYMIWSNLNGNLLSMYSGHSPIFQMDANGGSPAAVVNMLFQSLDSTLEYRNVTQVKLLPALPATWPEGSFAGGRLRDGLGIDMTWSASAVQKVTLRADRSAETRTVTLHSASFEGKTVTASTGTISQNSTAVTLSLAQGNSLDLTVS